MNDIEKAKRLVHLFYIMRKEHTSNHDHPCEGKFRKRDFMTLNALLTRINAQADGLVKMSDMSVYFRITPAAVSQMVREYERKGWVERVVLEQDRRSVYLKVTEEAKALLKQNEEAAMQGIIDFIHYLGEEDSEALVRILEKAKNYGPIMKHHEESEEGRRNHNG